MIKQPPPGTAVRRGRRSARAPIAADESILIVDPSGRYLCLSGDSLVTLQRGRIRRVAAGAELTSTKQMAVKKALAMLRKHAASGEPNLPDMDLLAEKVAARLKQDILIPLAAEAAAKAQHAAAQALVDQSPIRREDPVTKRLQERAVNAVLNGTVWLTSTEVGTRASPDARNKHALASRLLKEGRVFAIERAGHKEFPAYAFDSLGNPIPALRKVLGILEGYSPFRLASWFESTSSRLGGCRPRELLETDPDAVIAAARAQVEGPLHG